MTDNAAVAAGLRDKAKAASEGEGGENPPTWKPAAGDELVGTVTKVAYIGTRNGPAHIMNVAELDSDKVWTVWCTQTVLMNQVLDLAPAMDSVIVIIYEGKKHSEKSGYDYNSYQVQASASDFELWSTATKEGAERIKLKAEAMNPVGGGGVVDVDDLEAPY